jgi:hypothetical protein
MDEIDALAHRLWSVHPREIQDMGITREQFYAKEIRALFARTETAQKQPNATDTNVNETEEAASKAATGGGRAGH